MSYMRIVDLIAEDAAVVVKEIPARPRTAGEVFVPRRPGSFGRARPRLGPRRRFSPQPRLRPDHSNWEPVIDELVRWLPYVGPIIDILDIVDDIVGPSLYPDPDPGYKVPPGLYECARCDTPPGGNPGYEGIMRLSGTVGCPPLNHCISGQSVGGTDFQAGTSFTVANQADFGIWYKYRFAGGLITRYKHHRSFVRVDPGPWEFHWQDEFPGPSLDPAPAIDPNLLRRSPSPAPEAPVEPVEAQAPNEWQWVSGGPPDPPSQPHRRIPPARGSKERKSMTRSKQIMLWFFRALDNLSEDAEIVDAVFDALPADVKRRWSKGRTSRGFIDTAGQYGIDGADWKIQAIWWNFSKVDIQEAVKNIIKNAIEDEIIGKTSKVVPRNVINAFERELGHGKSVSPEMLASGYVDWAFDNAGV